MIATFFASVNRRLAVVLSLSLLAAFASCQKSKTFATSPLNRPKIDACSLISSAEVQSIQDSPIKDVKGSDHSDGSFRIAQCLYSAEPFNKSVSVAVTQSDPGSPQARNPKDFWKETFGRYEGEVKEEEGDKEKKQSLEEGEEREGGQPPKKIDGLGDDAFWTANRMGGALYVLKNDVYMRISVGGPDSEESKINHCKALAEKALSRL
jgi:hypothetical protein